jgi:RteC protein
VNVYQGAFTVYNYNSAADSFINANLKNISLGRKGKAEATELIYKMTHVGVLNHGRATILHTKNWFEQALQIELGNTSKTFQDIRNRKKETASFALKLDKALRQYIEQLDEEDLQNIKMKRA